MLRVLFVIVIGISLFLTHVAGAQESAHGLRVMSFNIRFGTADDGDNHWNNRRQIVAQVIKDVNPDIVGTQEVLEFQAEFLQRQLSDYIYVGRSREANPAKGEQCGIFFRKKRFAILGTGHFWLSETPDKPGSKSWDSSLPRIAGWLQLWDNAAEKSFYVINTHFDHLGKKARLESAKLIRQFVNRLPLQPQFVIVTGDFNAGQSSPPYQALFASPSFTADNTLILQDAFCIHSPKRTQAEGTFGGFKGSRSGSRIDWIACSESFQVTGASIVVKSYDGKYPSDHYPVVAELEFKMEN